MGLSVQVTSIPTTNDYSICNLPGYRYRTSTGMGTTVFEIGDMGG